MRRFLALALLLLGSWAGCLPASPDSSSAGPDDQPGESGAVEDKLVWVEEGIDHEDVVIALGYRTDRADPHEVEPIAMITRDGSPVANAMVFSRLVSADGKEATGEEAATVYEPVPDSDTAHYAQGRLKLPSGASQCVVRIRIVLPEGQQPWTRDMTIPLP